jgi:aerobic C4-dicarboxylate transport protein
MKRLTGHLYFWVLMGIILGGLIGVLDPATGASLKPLGDGFIALVKMLIAPVIFCTVVLGIAGAGDMKKVGRVGGKAWRCQPPSATLVALMSVVFRSSSKTSLGVRKPRTLRGLELSL